MPQINTYNPASARLANVLAGASIVPLALVGLARAVTTRLASGASPEDAADAVGLRCIMSQTVILPGICVCDGGSYDLFTDIAHSYSDPRDAAENYASACEPPDTEENTYWLRVRTYRVGMTVEVGEDGLEVEAVMLDEHEHRIARHPVEPPGDHDWRDDGPGCGVRGSGGGVVVVERCAITGWARVTDTWATDPADGTQGHTSIRYIPPEGAAVADWLDSVQAEKN